MRPQWWVACGIAALVVAGLVVWLTWTRPAPPDGPRARAYLDFTACLLTNSDGLAGTDAEPIWAGMQQASLDAHAKVQYLAVTGPQTPQNAILTLNSLAQRHCSQVFTAGAAPAAAARSSAGSFRTVTFFVVGGASGAANLVVLPQNSTTHLQESVRTAVTAAARHT